MDYYDYMAEWIRMLTIKRRRKKSWMVLMMWILTITWPAGAQAQCFGGVETYEKTAGVNLATSVTNVQGLLSQPGSAVTRDCAALCRQTANCAAFAVDYATSRCQSIDADGIKKREHLKDAPGVNYFEKICLRRINNFNAVCGDRQWAFERVLGAALQGFDDLEQTGVQSRADCMRLCLEQTTFVCRSADYDEAAQLCRLSREDRRTQPTAFRKDGSSWDYLENQCVRTLPDCRYTPRSEGSLTVSMDQVEFAQSQGECESLCDQARVFTCRAYSFTSEENRCYLSGDDTISHPPSSSTGQPAELSTQPPNKKSGTVLAEKICSVSHCENGIFTFEKVAGHFLRSARQEMLNRAKGATSTPSSRIIDSVGGGGITVECGRLCLEMGSDCPAYSVDYTQGRCFKLDRNSQGRAQELTIREGMSYFEKICLRGNVGPCRDRAWAFERHPSKELRITGLTEERSIPLVATRRDCQEACLRETRFVCRSARYDTMSLDCKLMSADKRLRPESFADAASHIEYLENQCVGLGNTVCSYQTLPDMYPRYLDALVSNISDEAACQALCTANRAFACRSYSFYASGSQCFLSSDDRVSAGPTALQSRPGTNYTERSCGLIPSNESSSGQTEDPRPVFSTRFPTSRPIFTDRPFTDPPGMGKNNQPQQPPGSKCRYGRPHYQRVAGYEAVPSRFISSRTPPPPPPSSGTTMSHSGTLMDCLDKCGTDPFCYGVNYTPMKESCVGVETDQESMDMGTLLFAQPRSNNSETLVLRPNAGVGYFESNCLHVPGCDGVWSTERTPGFFMRGTEREILRGVSRVQCTERCLDERRFVCRSASYDTSRQECHLSAEDRYTKPRSFQSNPIFDYIENQCSGGGGGAGGSGSGWESARQCRYGPMLPDRYLLYADRIVSGGSGDRSAGNCQTACDSERRFRCRSYSVHSPPGGTILCSLSSSSTPTYEFQRGAMSSERDCSSIVMTNEIPGQLETAHMGSNNGQRVFTSGTASGNVPAADPGGWVSLASLSRSQQVSGHHNSKAYQPPVQHQGSSPLMPGRPAPDPYRPPGGDVSFRRPVDATSYDTSYQYNTVGVSHRPVYPTDGAIPGLTDSSNVLRCRGYLSYDKVVNADFAGARRQEVRLSGDGNPTLECLRECDRQRDRCLSAIMSAASSGPGDYIRQGNWSGSPRLRCFILDRSASQDSASLAYAPSSVYFEKTCLTEASCGKPWTFVRVHGYELEGFDGQVARNVPSKEECQALCLRMIQSSSSPGSQGASTLCRSAEYLPRERICRMSSDNRRTQLRSFRAGTPDVIYMENQCAPDPPHCEYTDQTGRVSPWYDRSVTLMTLTGEAAGSTSALSECRRMCDTERDFLCKSVSVQLRSRQGTPLCLLSSEDSVSLNGANGVNSLMPDRDFTYSERSSCSNVRVECTKTDMLVTLAFGYPFNGRVYANGNYQSCFEMGNGQNQMVMRIPLVGPCGTVQATRGRYVNNIVVQHNPQIMQDSDSSVRVECAFEASEQTISYSPGGGRQGGGAGTGAGGLEFTGGGSIDVTAPVRQMGHSVVTNTAPTPALRMRILARNGQESRIVALGELLTLRIEVDPTSAFGIMARNVEARTDNGEVLTLIDASGCPRDINIFPPLDLDRTSKSLSADFKAFRFPSTATVNFIATVGFCQERCEPARCSDGWESYGRRRREAITNTSSSEALEEMEDVEEFESPSEYLMEETISSLDQSTTTTFKEEMTTTSKTHPAEETEAPTTTQRDVPTTMAVEIADEPTAISETSAETLSTRPSITLTIQAEEEEPGEEEKANNPSASDIEEEEEEEDSNLIPIEVPLQVQLIIAPEADRNAAGPSGALPPSPVVLQTGRSAAYNDRRHPYVSSYEAESPPVCTSKATVVAISIVAVLLHVLLLAAFYAFYRTRRARWAKLVGHNGRPGSPSGGLRHSGSISEVTFRSVYGQKSGPGSLSRAFHLNGMSSNPRGPHVASVFEN